MARFYTELNESLQQFIAEQHLFFVATAPDNGRINLSPKGMDSFRCLDNQHVAFMNLTGSGNETAAHLAQNGRLTIMFCSFDQKPLILRLYGQGQAVHRQDEAWPQLSSHFADSVGNRNIILMTVESVQTSCGFAVPYYDYAGERDTLQQWAETRGEAAIQTYWQEKNQVSIDGLPTGLFG